jgi:hypothetical protein
VNPPSARTAAAAFFVIAAVAVAGCGGAEPTPAAAPAPVYDPARVQDFVPLTTAFVARSGRLTAARRCSKAVFLKANGTTSRSLGVKRKLPRGGYKVVVRATDAAGNRQGTPAQRTVKVR